MRKRPRINPWTKPDTRAAIMHGILCAARRRRVMNAERRARLEHQRRERLEQLR